MNINTDVICSSSILPFSPVFSMFFSNTLRNDIRLFILVFIADFRLCSSSYGIKIDRYNFYVHDIRLITQKNSQDSS